MTDPTCKCGNAARYVDQNGALTCGICPIKAGDDSIRISDVPRLLAWARDFIHLADSLDQPLLPLSLFNASEHLRDIIQRRPA